MLRKNEVIVPVIRINNRKVNQEFLETNLGMKTVLEEGAFAEFGGHQDKTVKLVLQESPSNRTRAVNGTKKLHKIVIKVENVQEIEALLARGSAYSKLYQGQNGFAFEAVSPQGDTFLLHGEEDIADLTAILPPVPFKAVEDFAGLTNFEVETVWINTPQASVSQEFYDSILPNQDFVRFVGAQGPDLLTPAEEVWDLDSLRIPLAADVDWTEIETKLDGPYFKDRKASFLQTEDPSGIELWFEK